MRDAKRFGKSVGLHPTVQIVREFKILMRRDADATEHASALADIRDRTLAPVSDASLHDAD